MMPKSIESSEFDFSNENQSSLDNRGSVTSIGKKFRHQNYSKNIYIGTKNAEKWELIRSKLTFKNDVEFVCYLLKLAENDLVNNDEKSINDIELYRNNEKSKTGKFFKETTKTSENSNSFISSASKKCKKVHFNETSNGFGAIKLPRSEKSVDTTGGQNFTNYSVLSQNSQDAQDHSQCIDVKCDSSVPEILDCRIAEKIKNELEQKFGLDNGFSGSQPDNLSESDEVLCLATKLNVPTVSNDERPIVEKIKIKNLVAKKKRKSLKDCDKNTKLKNQFRIDLKAGTKKKTKVKGSKKKNDTRKVNKNQSTKTPKDVYKDNTDVTDSLEQTDCNAGSFPKDDDDDGVSLEKENLNDDEPQEQIQNDSSSDNCYSPTNEKSCILCLEDHAEEMCPLRNAVDQISDKISFNLWTAENHKINDSDSIGKHNQPLDDDKPLEEDLDHQDIETNDTRKSQNSYANASVPDQFELKQINGQSYGVFAKVMIPKHTKLGPLIGSLVKEVDISDDCNMSYIYESYDGAKSTYFSTEDENTSNWLRFVRPAQVRDIRNVAMIEQDGNIYMVTTMDIEEGCEIIYWSDECNSAWKRKKINKLNCGGCNIKFDHPLNYRTHCSIFHDPKLSLTIRKYHCKICANSFLGKESIMKHAAEMHDGKGAYQCQYCKKFFLRLNYLEMHRTYGCSANPQRTRPLCDFCGRKFCQPQKLKVHIKRMHSDLADVLRDFQCKLCSKLLGSRAALQRHSKEVHSRNSAVVSCPRCQKLFQNRSNLKIHMLTHSGVRPFKCAEVECNAAFTTKQCLQFHYKKVHNYTPEQMPKIERSVAYTFDAYSGGMKSNFVEQTSRRRRKSVDDQNSLIAASMLDDKSDLDEMSDDNSEFKKQESSKTESNFSFLSSKLNSMLLEHGTKRRKRDRKLKEPKLSKSQVSNSTDDILDDMKPNDRDDEMLNSMKQKQQNKQVSLIESLLASTSTRPILDSTDLTTKLPNNELIHDELEKNFKLQTNMIFKPRDIIMNSMQNLVLSKGSKKWISEADDNETDENGDGDEDDDENNEDDTNRNLNCADEKDLSHSNRDFISRLIMNGNQTGEQNDPDDENSSFLDVVDTNNCTQSVGRYPHTTSSTGSMIHADDQLPQMSQIPSHLHSTQNYLNNFYNNVTGNNTRTIPTSSTSTSASASLLVEAALNSVGNMINEDTDKNSNENTSLEGANESNTQIDVPINSIHSNTAHHNNALTSQENRFTSVMNNSLHNIDSDIKMMKGMANFPMQMPSLPMFSGTGTNISSQMDDLSSPNHNQGNLNTNQDNEIDVDSASTPRTMEPPDKMYNEQDPFNSQQDRQPQSPHIISPGRDYGMFNSNNNDIVSPLSSMQRQRSGYTDHELISPASSPAATMPRYDFNNDMYRKRTDNPMSRLINKTDNHHHHQHLSSDEESSIMAQNLSITNHNSNHGETELRMKYNNTQMDLIYNKYDHTNQTDLESTIRNKCIMEHNLDVSNFRNSMANETSIVNTDNMQGLDMTARTNLSGGFHHNFQLPTGNSNLNLGRYHHHIYDILSDREQDHTQLQMQQQQQMQHMLQDSLPNDHDTDQTTSVDLSRSGSYVVASPTSSISHTYSHSDMLRMSSLEIASNSGSMVGSNRSFISSQIQHTNRDSLDHHRYLSSAEQHRLLAGNGSTDQLGANHRLLVDPTAHLLMEQNSRLLSSDQSRLLSEPVQNRHMVASRGFGAYHQGVSTTNYHHGVRAPVLTPPSHHPTNPSNYHPFSSYY